MRGGMKARVCEGSSLRNYYDMIPEEEGKRREFSKRELSLRPAGWEGKKRNSSRRPGQVDGRKKFNKIKTLLENTTEEGQTQKEKRNNIGFSQL